MNTSKSLTLNELLTIKLAQAYLHQKSVGEMVDSVETAIVEAVEGIYGDSDGLREFASTGSNQVVTPSAEGVCQLCNADYVVWFAPNPLWNKVMRHPDGREASEKYAFVCPNCFTKRAEELGVAPKAWELREAE